MESVDHTVATEGLSEDWRACSEVRDDSIHRSAWKGNSAKFAMGKTTPASPTRPTRGYRSLMPVHYLADAILRSIDHRNPESRQLDHDDARPPQVRAESTQTAGTFANNSEPWQMESSTLRATEPAPALLAHSSSSSTRPSSSVRSTILSSVSPLHTQRR